MRFDVVLIATLLSTAVAAAPVDAQLDQLAKSLKAIRGTHDAKSQYDASPELTPIKHLLREWVEGQLPPLEREDDPKKFAARLNTALKTANLMCDSSGLKSDRCQEPFGSGGITQLNARGYLGDVDVSYLDFRHYLAVKSDVGVRCGFDESAYVYAWQNKAWTLVLASEQDRYDDKDYQPQVFTTIAISPTNVAWNAPVQHAPLVLTLGVSPWCSSNWQMLYTRLWRLDPGTNSPKPLLSSHDSYFLGDDDAKTRLASDDLFIEFNGESIDGGVIVRPHVIHYAVSEASVQRIGPVALSPSQFVDEWLTQPWSESAKWVDSLTELTRLRGWYTRFHEGVEIIFGEFGGAPLRCRNDRTLWDVEFTQQAGPKNPDISAHFLVRWMAPYRFTLVKINANQFAGCDIKDKMPDNLGALFPF